MGILEASKTPTVFQKRSVTFHDIKSIVYNIRIYHKCEGRIKKIVPIKIYNIPS